MCRRRKTLRTGSSAGGKMCRRREAPQAGSTAGGYTPKRGSGHSLCRCRREAPRAEKCAAGGKHRGRLNVQEKGQAQPLPPRPAGKDTEKPLPQQSGRGFFHTRKGAVRRGPSGGHRTADPPCGAAYRPSRRLRRAPDAEASAAGVRSTFLQSFEVALNSASLRP